MSTQSGLSGQLPKRNLGGRSSQGTATSKGKAVMGSYPLAPTLLPRYFEPAAATASFFLYAQGQSVIVANHDTLSIERRFARHSEEVQLLAVDTQSDVGAGRLVVSYDAGQTAIVWDLMTGDEIARFASYENLTTAAWMRNGNVAFGNTQGNIILFEPTTSEHISARTIDQIPVTALTPAADCRTFAIGYQNGSLLVATLQPRFTILHNLTTSRAPSPIVNMAWHASSSRQKSDMLAVQTQDGDLRVWSVAKSYSSSDPAKVVRILKRTQEYRPGANWMGWSKNGRIIQYSDSETLSWDVRTKHVTYDLIPTLEHVRGLAVYGPAATLFTLGASNTVQQFDLNTPAVMVANVQHPANLLPPSPPVSIEEQREQAIVVDAVESDTMSIPINAEISESDDEHMSPLARIVRGADIPDTESSDPERYGAASPVSTRSSSTVSGSSLGSGTHGRQPRSVMSKGMTERTYISEGSSLRSSRMHAYPEGDAYSLSSLSSASITSSSQSSRHRPSRLRHEVIPSPQEQSSKVSDLFKFTRSRLHDIPYKRPPPVDKSKLTNDDLRRQMLSIIFGWNKEIQDLVRDEMSRHPSGSPSRILLAKWLGDIDADIMATTSENMTSSDWMLLALSGIGGQASQHKLGRAYVQRLLENGDVHAAATIMIGMGDHNDAIEIYVSHKRYMEALILLCLFFPSVWTRQAQIVKKWGEFAVQHGQQGLAIRCFACTESEPSEPWTSPSAQQVSFQNIAAGIPEVLSPPLSPPGLNRGPQRSIAKTSALKLITSFDDKNAKSKFFAAGDGGQTPIAAGVTPIAESAISPGGHDPTTALVRPSNRSAFNTPSSAKVQTPGGFSRGRLPSIGEAPGDAPPRLHRGEQAKSSRKGHSRRTSTEEQMIAGLELQRAATASPMMMRDNHRRKEVPPPSPSPATLETLMQQQGRSSRNGPRARIPEGLELKLQSISPAIENDVTSPEQSVASSTRFHWPSRRRGPGSVSSSVTASSVTSKSSAGRSHRGQRNHVSGRTLDDYIHSLDAAHVQNRKTRSRESSRNRTGGTRDSSEDRGRAISRNWTPKPAKRSPTSPVPMSPEDLINLSTPRTAEIVGRDGLVVAIEPDARDPATVRKSSQIRIKPSSRTSSRGSRRRSPDRRPPALDLRGRSKSRGDAPLVRSPSSPLPMTAQDHAYGSDDDMDLKAALQAQEDFRTRHNRSRGLKDPTSPAVSRARERSSSRTRKAREQAALEDEARPMARLGNERSKTPAHAGDLKEMSDIRRVKKETAARELEERRLSLARRPSAPPIPHPNILSPPPTGGEFELPSTTFTPPTDLPRRSQTTEPINKNRMSHGRRGSNGPIIGLPATPKAMRLKFDSDANLPGVPAIPASWAKASPTGQSSPGKGSPQKVTQEKQPSPPSLLTLLPSTVYQPPSRPNIPRSMSAPPIQDEPPISPQALPADLPTHPAFHAGVPSSSRPLRGSVMRKVNPGHSPPGTLLYETSNGNSRGIDELLGGGRHGRKPSHDDIPPPPPPPPILKELQHLAIPPPPPPAPFPGASLGATGGAAGSGMIEIVMDDEEQLNIPVAAPVSDSNVPILAPPAPPSSRNGHARGRSSISDNSIGARFSRATERMRSASRGRTSSILTSRTKSPETAGPPVSFKDPGVSNQHRSIYGQQEGTGLHKNEFI